MQDQVRFARQALSGIGLGACVDRYRVACRTTFLRSPFEADSLLSRQDWLPVRLRDHHY